MTIKELNILRRSMDRAVKRYSEITFQPIATAEQVHAAKLAADRATWKYYSACEALLVQADARRR